MLIALFSKFDKRKAGVEMFDKIGNFGCVSDKQTYCFTMEALCRLSIYDWAWYVYENMLDGESLPDGE